MAEAPLQRYRQKRDFNVTSEPTGAPTRRRRAAGRSAVVRRSRSTGPAACTTTSASSSTACCSRWAVPKGPSFDPADEAHGRSTSRTIRSSYGSFEGTIPKGQYGAGTVIVWDRGTWEPVGDPRQGMAEGQAGLRAARRRSWPACGSWCASPSPATSRTRGCCSRSATRGRGRAPSYDVVAALPDSVVAQPLGPVEAREPRGVGGAARSDASAERRISRRAVAARAAGASWSRSWRPRRRARRAGRVARRDQVRRLPPDGAHRGRQGAR